MCPNEEQDCLAKILVNGGCTKKKTREDTREMCETKPNCVSSDTGEYQVTTSSQGKSESATDTVNCSKD